MGIAATRIGDCMTMCPCLGDCMTMCPCLVDGMAMSSCIVGILGLAVTWMSKKFSVYTITIASHAISDLACVLPTIRMSMITSISHSMCVCTSICHSMCVCTSIVCGVIM